MNILIQGDCKQQSARICSTILGKSDFQLGLGKVFLKDAQGLYLEQERERVLNKKLIIIQRSIRGWIHRRRFIRQRKAAIVIQREWKRYTRKRNFLVMRNGFLRLQAAIRSRYLSTNFENIRYQIVRLQVSIKFL